jgi:phage shock protein A
VFLHLRNVLQVDDFMANAGAQMSELSSKMESFAERAEAALQAAKDELANTSERMAALEKRVEELSNALDANGEADRKLQEALKRVRCSD